MIATAHKAVAFAEALDSSFFLYIANVLESARALAGVLTESGAAIVSGRTDNHLVLVDLRPLGLKGNQAAEALERAGITCNKNGIPGDPEKPTVTSGIRLGTAAGCSRGFRAAEFQEIGDLVSDVLTMLRRFPDGNHEFEQEVRRQVRSLCRAFPIYGVGAHA